ncbi:MAG TPA: inositol 2-dehydrogenase [Anaerolineales bacterium]|jgi:myo-inositol 2-dehydrogenase/D-chiro-inositol 1-dehydrogenase|nr:inositol 2-dehydrogenase [Anaerolineales bacterium]
MIKFGQFGAGFIGKIHGANIAKHPRAELAYIYDVNREAAEQLAVQLGAKVADSPEEIWSSEASAVLIASSTNTHADLLRGAIEAGKSIYCEKPIDLDMNRVKAVVQQAQHTELPILVGFSRRFDANHNGIREAFRSGGIGKLEMMHITARDPKPPPLSYVKVSGGQLRDQTIHFFDMLRWLAGEDPVEVYATGAALVDPAIAEVGDVDTSMVILKFASGALCHINCSRRTEYGYDERVELFGSKGMAVSRRKPRREVTLYKGDSMISDGLHPGWFERMEPTFYRALDTFIRAVEGENVEYPTLIDGLKAQMIAEAAVESLHTNQPVKISYWSPA